MDPLGTSGGPLGDPLGTSWGSLGDILGTFGDLLGTSWGPLGEHLGTFGDAVGRLGHALAIPWVSLTSSFGRFMCLLDILWAQLGAPRDSQRLPTEIRKTTWRYLGSILEAFGGVLEGSGSKIGVEHRHDQFPLSGRAVLEASWGRFCGF